jgi:chaperonin cofactor prefoldin
MSLPARLQAASSEYQRLQTDLSNAVEARQRLDAQLSENELVNKVRETSILQELQSSVADHGHCRSLPR